MPTYTYKARDEAGKAVNGVLEAISRDEVAVKLRDMGYMVSRVDETPASSIGLKRFGDRLRLSRRGKSSCSISSSPI